MDYRDHELKHYGVQGMKCGVRKAEKAGDTYEYKSHGQKKYEKKVTKLKERGATPTELQNANDKLAMFRERDRARLAYTKRASVGASVARTLLAPHGFFGNGSYQRLRAAGLSKGASAIVGYGVSTLLTFPVGVIVTKAIENDRAKKRLGQPL